MSEPTAAKKRERSETDENDLYFPESFSRASERFAYLGSVPTTVDERTFPKARYRSRGQEVKIAVHWGQRKLLLSEMQLLTYFCDKHASYWIVYVGAAPGSHLLFLDSLYQRRHTWELIDPGKWDHRLEVERARAGSAFTLRNEFFDNHAAYELAARRLVKAKCPGLSAIYAAEIRRLLPAVDVDQASRQRITDGQDPEAARTAEIPIRFEPPVELEYVALGWLTRVASERCKMLFISDVRSGSESAALGEFERHVFENTRAQEAWTDIVNPSFAMLKFRLPYSFITKYDHAARKKVTIETGLPTSSRHPNGTVLLPVWTRPTSTECRLVVPEYCGKRMFVHSEFEDAMFFFNSVMRERVHFEHDGLPHPWVNHQYDGAAEAVLLAKFAVDEDPRRSNREVRARALEVSELITKTIGGSFEQAVRNRDAIHIGKGTRGGWLDETERRLEEANRIRRQEFWQRNLTTAEQSSMESRRAWHGLIPLPAAEGSVESEHRHGES